MIHSVLSANADRDLVVALVSPLLTAFFLGLLIRCFLHILRYHRYRRAVIGQVTNLELREVRGRLCAEIIVAQYTIDGRTYDIRSAYSYPYSYYRVGDDIPLRVSETTPERAVMPYDLRNSKIGLLLFAILFLLSLLCMVLVW